MPGTAYVLFHHVMGECDGARGVWGYVRGGMGGISSAIAAAAREKGAEIRTNATVARILTRDGAAAGVVLEDGTELSAHRVASGVDAHVTFLRLLDPSELPPEFLADVRAIDYASASLKINLALSAVPNFTALPGAQPGPQHRGTIHLCPTLDYIEEAYDDAKHGRAARNPIIEATIPSVLDDTVAPKGMHVMSMFTQYFPYDIREGSIDYWKERYADRCIEIMDEYAPGFKQSVVHRQVLSPRDLEARFGLTGGNIMQGAMSLSSLSFMRPVAGYADYRTPIRGLYLCGAATHPGGGVMGACGYNAAREILKDAGRRLGQRPDPRRRMPLERTLPRDAYFADYVWQMERSASSGANGCASAGRRSCRPPATTWCWSWRGKACCWYVPGPARFGPSTMSAATEAAGWCSTLPAPPLRPAPPLPPATLRAGSVARTTPGPTPSRASSALPPFWKTTRASGGKTFPSGRSGRRRGVGFCS